LALLAWGELTYEEAAVALDVAIGTIRSRAHRARARVRELIDAETARTGVQATETDPTAGAGR
jgi:RNA polymerase sigma-70 factor (ECF subfamily)